MKKLLVVSMLCLFFTACNVEKEEKGEMPEMDVDVSTESGEMPEYDVNWADVDVTTNTKTVEVPKVVVVMEEETVEVPHIDIKGPDGEDTEERTVMVEAEVTGSEHDLEIQEIWAAKNNLYVISKLEAKEQTIGDKTMRVSDQITLNAPELNVKHYIVGKRPDRGFNKQYKYVNSKSELKSSIESPEVIYTR